MKRLSLRDRVTLASTAVLAVALVVVGVAVNLMLSQQLAADADSVLRNRAAAELSTLDSSHGDLRVRETSNDKVLDRQSWVFDRTGVVERARAGSDIQAAALSLARIKRPTFLTVAGRDRLYALPVYRRNGDTRAGTVVIGISLVPYTHTERIGRIGTIVFALFILLAGAFTVRWAVRRALLPVEEMTKRAADWSEHDLHRRFALGKPYDELSGLAATLDTLLSRIDTAMRGEQRLTAEIAHELRTPLTSIRAEADLALRSGTHDNETLRNVIAGTDRMSAAIETLLAARAGESATNRTCDPLETINLAVDTMRAGAAAKGVEIEVNSGAGAGRVETDPQVLAQTIAPLLDNAVRHAVRKARVAVELTGDEVIIRVDDDGTGVAAGTGTEIFEPGVSGEGGSGLGLPLARRLARTYGAEITAIESPNGGRFELRIPAATAAGAHD